MAPTFKLATGAPKADLYVVPVFSGGLLGPGAQLVDDAIGGTLAEFMQETDFDGKRGEVLAVPTGGKLGALPTEVIFADDTLNPDTGKQLMERLLKRDRVNLVTGIVFSNVMLAVWPTIEEAKIFYIAPNATPTRPTVASSTRGR